MVVKIKEFFEKTRQVKKMINLRNTFYEDKETLRYYERVLSNKKKSYNINFISNST